MSPALLILIAIMALPVVILLALRINAALVFLSLCLGDVLVQFVAPDSRSLIGVLGNKVPAVGSLTDSSIKLILLLLPTVLTAVFMIKTIRGGRQALNALPALGVGCLAALLVVPVLPTTTSIKIMELPLWGQFTKLQVLLVGASTLVCLLVLWMQRPKTGGEGKHSKHHG